MFSSIHVPRSSVLVPIPLKICVALLRIVLSNWRHFHVILNAKRLEPGLEVVMVEGFPSFGTKACDHRRQQQSWFGCRAGSDVSSIFYTGFATESSMTSQSKTRNDVHLLPGGGGTPIYNWRGCSSKISKETPKSYHIGRGSSQFYSLKVTSEIFIHRNNTGILKIIAKGQRVLL